MLVLQQLSIMDGNGDEISDQQMQLVLVGYIRGLNSMVITVLKITVSSKIQDENII